MTHWYLTQIEPTRPPTSLPVYTDIVNAIPFLKNGTFALHSETASAYPEIARIFDANDICDLRVVSLFELVLSAWKHFRFL